MGRGYLRDRRDQRLDQSGKGDFVPGHGHLSAWGSEVPADGEEGYATSCLFQQVDAVGSATLFTNVGNQEACLFRSIASFPSAQVSSHAVNYDVLAIDHGKLLVATAAVAFTLPTKQKGLAFRFAQTVDSSLSVLGSSDILVRGSASASAVIFDTGSQRIGSHVLLECIELNGGTLKWLVSNLGGTTLSVV